MKIHNQQETKIILELNTQEIRTVLGGLRQTCAASRKMEAHDRDPLPCQLYWDLADFETAKELRKSAGEVILKKEMQAAERGDLSFHQVERFAARLEKGEKVPDDFLRRIGINVPGRVTRSEAMTALEKALDRGEINFREFSIGEDLLNCGTETPRAILKSLETRRKTSDEGERLIKSSREKDSPSVRSRLYKSNEVDLNVIFNRNLSGEQEIFLRHFPAVGPGMASLIAKSFCSHGR